MTSIPPQQPPDGSLERLVGQTRLVQLLVTYIGGCQPAVVAADSSLRPQHNRWPDPTDPENIAAYAWGMANNVLGEYLGQRKGSSPARRRRILKTSIRRAAGLVKEELAEHYDISARAKLVLPVRLAELAAAEPEWFQSLWRYFERPG